MSLSHAVTTSVRGPSGSGRDTSTVTGDTSVEINETVAAGDSVDLNISVEHDNIVSFFISSTKDVTLKRNTSAQTHSLLAGKAWWWNNGLDATNPITGDITQLTLQNDGDVDSVVTGSILLDSNPS
jgi:hypothetical protein